MVSCEERIVVSWFQVSVDGRFGNGNGNGYGYRKGNGFGPGGAAKEGFKHGYREGNTRQ